MATIEDNDPFYDGANMLQGTSRADLIFNEYKARAYASTVAIKEFERDDPPVSPNEYDAYIIGPNPTPASGWDGLPGRLTVCIGGWKFMTVKDGMRVQVQEGPPGQEGRYIDRFANSWSSLGGVQTASIEDKGGGLFEAEWDLKYGDTAIVTLNQPTVQIARPIGVRHGRRFYMIVKQDGAGSRQIVYKDAQFMTTNGSTTQPTAAANAVTAYTFLWPSAAFLGPMELSVVPNLLQTV